MAKKISVTFETRGHGAKPRGERAITPAERQLRYRAARMDDGARTADGSATGRPVHKEPRWRRPVVIGDLDLSEIDEEMPRGFGPQ
jgi:hypothetical protein